MKNKKILILYGQPGMGHLMPARALAEIFAKKYPEIEIKVVDVFDLCSKIFRLGFPILYHHTVSKFPAVFEIYYNSYKNKLLYKILEKGALFFTKRTKFLSFIKDFSPDFIISTHPLPLQLVSLLEEAKIINILSVNVCTDFTFHPAWYSPDINYYCVANKEMQESLIGCNVTLDKIKITGIPIRDKFSQKFNRKGALLKINLDPLKPVLLIIGGYLVYKELLKVINIIKSKNSSVQFIVVAGRDKALSNNLEKANLNNDKTVRIFGLVDNIEEFMVASDLVLSKAGGSTVAECLNMGLPMVVNKFIPGQEEGNLDYLTKNNAGIKAVGGAEDIAKNILDLINNPKKITEMKENCRKLGRPNAANEIVDFVFSKL